MSRFHLPLVDVPADMASDEMPDLLRHWYLGPRARRHLMLRRFEEVDSELSGRKGDRVLDIGSAWGFNVMALNRLGYRVTGMDLIIDQFEAGKRIASANDVPLDVLGADAAALPFPDESFDCATMVETFEHIYIDDRVRALAECCRVLRPGGRLVLSTPNYRSLIESAKRVTGNHPWMRRKLPTMCYPEEGTDRGDYHPYQYHHPLPDEEIVRMIVESGFSIERVKHFLFILRSVPNAVFPLARAAEAIAERIPGVRRLAATSCFVAIRLPGKLRPSQSL